MVRPTLDEVRKLTEKGNLIPIWMEMPADLETPASVYLKLRNEGPSFLLESVERGEQVGRYSFLGIDPIAVLTARAGNIVVEGRDEEVAIPQGDPLAAVEALLARYQPVPCPELPEFYGGMVGYLGYDAVRFFERASLADGVGLDLPDAVFLLADTVAAFDHVKRQLLVVTNIHVGEQDSIEEAYARGVKRIGTIAEAVSRPLPEADGKPEGEETDTAGWVSNVERADFEEAVLVAKKYIRAGDVFQVVLSQRLSRRTDADPFAIYRALRMLNPSPYMFYLDLPDGLRIIGSSPETMVRLQGQVAEVRPIAGTRRRGVDRAEDKALADELLADPKERAEHVMLVDLGRNDLGRVCRYGTVEVPELMQIEEYSHVMHIVSSVLGQLKLDRTAFDLLRATFPAGTVSGAPKVRAMEIIADLEREQRGPYAGAVGYFGYGGAMDTCITIRTLVMHNGKIHVQAGAGIVADSDPRREFEETLSKARALAEAVERAENSVLVTQRRAVR